jgi:hypothetical protein
MHLATPFSELIFNSPLEHKYIWVFFFLNSGDKVLDPLGLEKRAIVFFSLKFTKNQENIGFCKRIKGKTADRSIKAWKLENKMLHQLPENVLRK